MYRLVLASKSPRRKEILSQIGLEFDIVVSQKDEVITCNMPSDIVKELSEQKAKDVYKHIIEEYKDNVVNNNLQQSRIIIAADTIVSIDDMILGKPKDRQEAFDMINRIQGREHSVYTGVTLLIFNYDKYDIKTFYEETKVNVYNMSEEMINRYLDMGDYKDKAGAYGIQGNFSAYVRSIEGDYYTVVGLPISRIVYELREYMDLV